MTNTAGTGAPIDPLEGDQFVDLAHGTLYRRVAGAWVLQEDEATPPPAEPQGLYAALIDDMKRPHVAAPDGVPVSYDWQARPRVGIGLNGAPPYGNVWGHVYAAQTPSTNTLVEVANHQLWVLAGGKWTLAQHCKPDGSAPVDAGMFRTDYAGNVTSATEPLRLPSGSRAGEPDIGYMLHHFPAGRARMPATFEAVLSCYDARLVLQAPDGVDDRGTARFIAGAGGDWYDGPTALPPRGDWAIGRFRWVTQGWTTYTAHAGTINASNLPPITMRAGDTTTTPPVEPPTVVNPPATGPWHLPAGRPVRIMPMGDSITWHQANDPGGWDAAPAMLAQHGIQALTVGTETGRSGIRHQGIGGWCIDDTNNACTHSNNFHADGMLEHVDRWLHDHTPDVIVLNAGANDAFTNRAANVEQYMGTMLLRILEHAPQAFTLVTIPRSWSDIPQLHSPDLGWSCRGIEAAVLNSPNKRVRLFNAYARFALGKADWRDYVHPAQGGVAKMIEATVLAIVDLK